MTCKYPYHAMYDAATHQCPACVPKYDDMIDVLGYMLAVKNMRHKHDRKITIFWLLVMLIGFLLLALAFTPNPRYQHHDKQLDEMRYFPAHPPENLK